MKENLLLWMRANLDKHKENSKDLIYGPSAVDQMIFVRDVLTRTLNGGMDNCFIVGWHTSKSVELPVYMIEVEGLQVILRNNFHNWKMSVISNNPIEADFSGLFHTTPPVEPDYTGNPLASCYFEGFPGKYIFGYYEESDKKKWSAEIGSKYSLVIALYLIAKQLGGFEPLVWGTQANFKERMRKQDKEWKAKNTCML